MNTDNLQTFNTGDKIKIVDFRVARDISNYEPSSTRSILPNIIDKEKEYEVKYTEHQTSSYHNRIGIEVQFKFNNEFNSALIYVRNSRVIKTNTILMKLAKKLIKKNGI